MEEKAVRFIGESVEVSFGDRRGFEKRPECPEEFSWRGRSYVVQECLSEWKDYGRRGKMAHNMRPSHLKSAEKRGSRGVGRHYFRIRTDTGQTFDLYYDRAPRDTQRSKGGWQILQELGSDSK